VADLLRTLQRLDVRAIEEPREAISCATGDGLVLHRSARHGDTLTIERDGGLPTDEDLIAVTEALMAIGWRVVSEHAGRRVMLVIERACTRCRASMRAEWVQPDEENDEP
jgi:hypothetical protein